MVPHFIKLNRPNGARAGRRLLLGSLVVMLAVLLPLAYLSAAGAQSGRDAVTGLTAVPGDDPGELVITWDAHPDNAKDYRVSWAPQEESFRTYTDTDWNAFPIVASHTVTGLEAGASYKVRVRARFQNGGSPWSAVVIGSAGAASGNNAPEFASTGETRSLDETVGDAVATAGNIGAALPAASDADGDGIDYTLGGADAGKFDLDGASRQLRSRAGEKYDHEARASYSVELIASDGNGGTARLSVTVNVADRDEPPLAPGAPTVAGVSGAEGSLDVSWDAPVNAGRPAIDGYDLRYRELPDGDWTDGPQDLTGTSATISGLTAGTEYEVQVRAGNDEGEGQWSGAGSATAAEGSSGTDYAAERAEAVALGDITDTEPTNIEATVDDDDGIDYYSFSLSDARIVRLRIRSLERNADLYLEDSDGEVIVANETAGNAKEVMNVTLDATGSGELYYVRVEAKETGTNRHTFRYLTEEPPAEKGGGSDGTVRGAGDATGQPTISGTAESGETLTAAKGDIADSDGTTRADDGEVGYAYTYQWVRVDGSTETDISGATGSTYVLTSDDVGKKVKVRVSFKDDADNAETLTSAATDTVARPANNTATGQPVITGTALVGETLTADTSGISDANGLTNPQYAYQWMRSSGGVDTDISGATAVTHTLTDDDLSSAIKVRVSFTDDVGYSEALTSAATGPVQRPPNAPPSGQPTISGTVEVGETLSADTSAISDANGLTGAQFSYQWLHSVSGDDTDISGATGATYTVVDGDANKAFKVRVSFTDDDGYAHSVVSDATDLVLVTQQAQQAPAQSTSEPEGEDFAGDNTTEAWVVVGDDGAEGDLGAASDVDAFRINLEAGQRYRIYVVGDGPRDFASGGTYAGDVELMVRTLDDAVGTGLERVNGFGTKSPSDTTINNVVNIGSGPDGGAWSVFDVVTTGTYLVKVISDGSNTGTYTVRASEITSEPAFGDFTSQWNSGRIKIDDSAAMTGEIGDANDSDWYKVTFEAGKCYAIHVKGEHSDSDHDGGTLEDPKVKVINFYDYYDKRFYDPDTLAFVGVPDDEKTEAYYDETYINPSNFTLLNSAEKVCNTVEPHGQTDTSKLICNYYCDDDGGPGNNSLIKVQVSTGGEGDYVIGVEGQGSTGTYSVFVEEITCPSD